jgi:hypothetical protein
MRQIAIIALTCLALAACAEGRQRHLESRKLDSGVTGDNGGGQSVLHDNPNVGVSPSGVTETGTRNKNQQPQ